MEDNLVCHRIVACQFTNIRMTYFWLIFDYAFMHVFQQNSTDVSLTISAEIMQNMHRFCVGLFFLINIMLTSILYRSQSLWVIVSRRTSFFLANNTLSGSVPGLGSIPVSCSGALSRPGPQDVFVWDETRRAGGGCDSVLVWQTRPIKNAVVSEWTWQRASLEVLTYQECGKERERERKREEKKMQESPWKKGTRGWAGGC